MAVQDITVTLTSEQWTRHKKVWVTTRLWEQRDLKCLVNRGNHFPDDLPHGCVGALLVWSDKIHALQYAGGNEDLVQEINMEQLVKVIQDRKRGD